MVVYIHPKANADTATRAMVKTVQRLQGIVLDAPNFVMGDFNNCKPGMSLGNFYQYVTCTTRLMKCLDLCYGSLKGVYKSRRKAPLSMSDHKVIYLVLSWPVLKRNKPEWRLVPVCSEESINASRTVTAIPTGTCLRMFVLIWMNWQRTWSFPGNQFPFIKIINRGSPYLSKTQLSREY